MNASLILTSAALRDQGWTDHRIVKAVAAGRIVRVERNAYRWAGELEPREAHLARVRAILGRQTTEAVASHASAAVLHDLPLPDDAPEEVQLTLPGPAKVRRRSGYHVHIAPLSDEDVVTVDGVRVTSLARTAADLARCLPFSWAVAANDRAMACGVTREELEAVVEAAGRRRGIEAARRVVAFADGRSGSVAESVSRVTMNRAGVPVPELQFQVIGPQGWVAFSDFAWPGFGVVGEMDGEAKYADRLVTDTPEKVFGAERARDDLIREADWWPCHWGWATAWNATDLGERIRQAFEDAARFRRSGR